MRTYYPSLQAIHQQTMQLKTEQCAHCGQFHQLVSHGFIRQKQPGGDPQPVGKRVFCSNRHHHSGCGRTMQLYLDSRLRRMHYTARDMMLFVLWLLAGNSIALAYTQVTHANNPRHAYRWWQRLLDQITTYRSLFHQPLLLQSTAPAPPPPTSTHPHDVRRNFVVSTLTDLLYRLKHPLCQTYQAQWQQAFF